MLQQIIFYDRFQRLLVKKDAMQLKFLSTCQSCVVHNFYNLRSNELSVKLAILQSTHQSTVIILA